MAEADSELSSLVELVPYPFVALMHFSMLNDYVHWSAIDLLNVVAGENTCKVVFLDCIDPKEKEWKVKRFFKNKFMSSNQHVKKIWGEKSVKRILICISQEFLYFKIFMRNLKKKRDLKGQHTTPGNFFWRCWPAFDWAYT